MWLINTTTFKREFRQPESSSSAELSEAINSMLRWYEIREFWPCIDLQPLRSPLLPNSNLRTTDKESQTFARALGTVLGVKSSPGRPGESGSGTQVLYRHTAEGGSAGERGSGVVCKVG
ncbi:hypothetical protein PoMZ_12349 [Pyricularia oryzae]|uniref:Uncharacterized protein n=1 Tax=Pyricularia oryzae TaxID=318829 RepID=A0A4P7NSP7_PYROR|nr:hypothetical protein PoMZ_12349 [Pyricularia oryzae]